MKKLQKYRKCPALALQRNLRRRHRRGQRERGVARQQGGVPRGVQGGGGQRVDQHGALLVGQRPGVQEEPLPIQVVGGGGGA